MKIKFTRDYAVKAAGGPSYEAGQVVDLPESSAQHFLNRGAAVEAGNRPEEVSEKPTKKAKADK